MQLIETVHKIGSIMHEDSRAHGLIEYINNERYQTRQTSPRAPSQGAATWRIWWHDPRAIARRFRQFHDDSCNRLRLMLLTDVDGYKQTYKHRIKHRRPETVSYRSRSEKQHTHSWLVYQVSRDHARYFFRLLVFTVNPLECKVNYSATSNDMKLVHWPLMGGLLHLVQRGGD